jgi:hypothetical protein
MPDDPWFPKNLAPDVVLAGAASPPAAVGDEYVDNHGREL